MPSREIDSTSAILLDRVLGLTGQASTLSAAVSEAAEDIRETAAGVQANREKIVELQSRVSALEALSASQKEANAIAETGKWNLKAVIAGGLLTLGVGLWEFLKFLIGLWTQHGSKGGPTSP